MFAHGNQDHNFETVPSTFSLELDGRSGSLSARFAPSSNLRTDIRVNAFIYRALSQDYRSKSLYSLLKRTVDIVIALSILVVLTPLFAIIFLLIKATDRGPALFWQTRVGRGGKEFPFPKFRSMVPDAEKRLDSILHLNEHKSGVTFKIKKDPRATWIGRLLRKTSLDELPQFWCVLMGQMTLVGPRPAVPREVALYTPEERRRLDATPGLTCIWQVSGRGNVPFPMQVEMDVEYIEKQCLWLDTKLLMLTIPAVLSGKGAY